MPDTIQWMMWLWNAMIVLFEPLNLGRGVQLARDACSFIRVISVHEYFILHGT